MFRDIAENLYDRVSGGVGCRGWQGRLRGSEVVEWSE